jgi:hypothetical protein
MKTNKKLPTTREGVRDLALLKADRVVGGKKLPGKRKPPTITL